MNIENIDISKMSEEEICHYGSLLWCAGDIDNAVKYYTLAADNGYTEAMMCLARIYETGDGVEQNKNEAIRWYKLAAEKGDYEAIYHLSEDITLNYAEEPLDWCVKVAEHGDTFAQLYLAEIYHDGKGVEKNFEEYLKWYKMVAEDGDSEAIYHLGYMYYYGDEVEQNYNEAYYWFNKDDFRYLPHYICADMYFYVDKDYKTAFRLYKASLEQDWYEEAAYKIGEMYFYGLGVEKAPPFFSFVLNSK